MSDGGAGQGGAAESPPPAAPQRKLDRVRFLSPGEDEEVAGWAQVLEPANLGLSPGEACEDGQLFAVAEQLRRRGFALVDTGAGAAFGALEGLMALEPRNVLRSKPDRLSPAFPRHLTDWAAFVTRLQNAADPADPKAVDPMQALFAIPMECVQFRGEADMKALTNLHVDAGRGDLYGVMEDKTTFPFGAFNAWWTACDVEKQLVAVSSCANMGPKPARSARYARRRGPGGPSPEEWRDSVFVSPRDMRQKVLLLWSLISPALADASESSALLPPAPRPRGCRSAGVLHGASSIKPERLRGRSGEAKLCVVPLAALDPLNEVWRATAPPRTQAAYWYWVARTGLASAPARSFDYLAPYWQWVREMLDCSADGGGGSAATEAAAAGDAGEAGEAGDAGEAQSVHRVLRRGSELGLPCLHDPVVRAALEEGCAAYCDGDGEVGTATTYPIRV